MALLDKDTRFEAEEIQQNTQYMNLAEQPGFMQKFVGNTGFDEAKD
jgi:hypothetical protein